MFWSLRKEGLKTVIYEAGLAKRRLPGEAL
jgi:hypothetical protein